MSIFQNLIRFAGQHFPNGFDMCTIDNFLTLI